MKLLDLYRIRMQQTVLFFLALVVLLPPSSNSIQQNLKGMNLSVFFFSFYFLTVQSTFLSFLNQHFGKGKYVRFSLCRLSLGPTTSSYDWIWWGSEVCKRKRLCGSSFKSESRCTGVIPLTASEARIRWVVRRSDSLSNWITLANSCSGWQHRVHSSNLAEI